MESQTKVLRQRMHHSIRALFLMVSVFFVMGCSKPVEKAIVGKWLDVANPEGGIEFFQDNTFLMTHGKEQRSGTWSKVGDDRIKANLVVMGTSTTLVFEEIKIDGDQMSLKLNGEVGKLTRKK